MSKFYGYDETMENDIAKITTPKLALMSDVVASDKKFIRMENGCGICPWDVNASFGVWCVCDSL